MKGEITFHVLMVYKMACNSSCSSFQKKNNRLIFNHCKIPADNIHVTKKDLFLKIIETVKIFSRPIEQSFFSHSKREKVNTIKINYCNKNQGVVHFFSSLLIITTISIRNRALLKFFSLQKEEKKHKPNSMTLHKRNFWLQSWEVTLMDILFSNQ